VASEFFEQGDLEREQLHAEPIVSLEYLCVTTGSPYNITIFGVFEKF
jgi:hypothetical protein